MTDEEKIQKTLDKIRPYIQTHGGDVVFHRLLEGTAYLKVHGACVNCGLASVTYNKMVAPLLIKEVEGVKEVVFE